MAVLIDNLQDEVQLEAGLEELVEKVVLAVLGQEGRPEGAEVSVVFTDDAYIRELNSQYRGLDCPTDVLSFAQLEGDPMPGPAEEDLLGDVVISLPTALRQGEEYGHGLRREVAYLTAHGVLHLLGYDHQDEAGRALMRQKEEAALARLGLERAIGM